MTEVAIYKEQDILLALSVTRRCLQALQFSKLDEQKVLVSVSELTRNILDHAKGAGVFVCETVGHTIRIRVSDNGPGISNLDEILHGKKSKHTNGLGLGLMGVHRLMDECIIDTSKGGTTIIAVKRGKFDR